MREALFVEYPVVEYADARFRLRRARGTDPEMIGLAIVGHYETRITVRTEISGQDTQPRPPFGVQARFHRHVFESPVPQVVKKLRHSSFKRLRPAIVFWTLRQITRPAKKLNVVNHDQIEETVPIVVDKRGTGGPAG